MPKNTSKPPAYQRIKSAILANIHSGIWTAGTAIPTEMALTETFGVSRMTVNRALKELTDEQILERRQGSGTFVAQNKFNQTFITVHNVRQDIEQIGKHYHANCIFAKEIAYDKLPDLAKSLFLHSQILYEVHIVHYGDGEPLQVERRIVDIGLVPDFSRQNFNLINTSDFLIKKVPLVHGKYKIIAANCPDDIAQLLGVGKDTPVLLLRRHTYSSGLVVTLVEMWQAGDSFMFEGVL